MKPMFLAEVEAHEGEGRYANGIRQLSAQGLPVPQIMHLFAYKPDRTEALAEFTQGVMRGPSALSAGSVSSLPPLRRARTRARFESGRTPRSRRSCSVIAASCRPCSTITKPRRSRDGTRALFRFLEKMNRAVQSDHAERR